MTKAKHNQARRSFTYENDDKILVPLGQFIRDTRNIRVERKWYVIFDKHIGHYLGFKETIPENFLHKFRNPDLILIKDGKLKLVIEVDGGVHDERWADTEERNEQYIKANVPLVVINLNELETSIFDAVDKALGEYLE